MRIKKTFSALLLSLLLIFVLTGCEQVTLEETETAVNAASEAFDAQAAADAIIAYCGTHDDTAEIEASLSEKFEGLCAAGDYQNFEWMDSVVDLLADYPLQEGLQRILDDNGVARAKSFLEGTWVRCDGTKLDGCEITIKVSDATVLGIITDASNIKDSSMRKNFRENDIKWDNVSIIDEEMITFDDLTKYDSGGYAYSPSTAKIDYEFSSVYVHVTDDGDEEYARGNEQVWVKKDFIDRYSNVEPLNEADNHFSGLSLEDNGEIENVNCADYPGYIMWYCFDPAVDKVEDVLDIITTARDVHISTPKQEVIEKYGIGDFKMFSKDTDEFYRAIASHHPEVEALVVEQCVSSVSYVSAYCYLSFYFDEDDTVSWVVFQMP